MQSTRIGTNDEMNIATLLLTHISNMLLIIHCATNWILFYRWPRRVQIQFRTRPGSLGFTPALTPHSATPDLPSPNLYVRRTNHLALHTHELLSHNTGDNYVLFNNAETTLLHKIWSQTDQRTFATELLKVLENKVKFCRYPA